MIVFEHLTYDNESMDSTPYSITDVGYCICSLVINVYDFAGRQTLAGEAGAGYLIGQCQEHTEPRSSPKQNYLTFQTRRPLSSSNENFTDLKVFLILTV